MPQASLTTGRPWRVVLLFAVPLFVGNVVQQLYQVTDAFIVGRGLGVDALAAVGSTGSLLFLLMGFSWGMTSGFAIPTAQAFGSGDAAAVRRSVAAGTLLTAGGSVVITVGSLLLARPALELLQTPPELLDDATTFATVTFAGAAATMAFNYLAGIIRAIGDSRTPLVFLAVSCVINGALVAVLVGVVGTGVGGAALATVVSQALSVVLCLAYVRRRVPALHIGRADLRAAVTAFPGDLRHHLRIGLPMGFQASIIAIGALVVQVTLNELGSDAVAAYTAASRVDQLAVALLASLGLAVSTFVAQNHGALRPDRIRAGVLQATAMSVAGAVVLGAVLIAWGSDIVRLFLGGGEEQVVDMAAWYLTVNGAMYAVLGVLFVLRGALQGLGRTLVPTLSGVLELVMRIAAALTLGAAFGYRGVVWSNPLAWIGSVLLLVPAYAVCHRALGRRSLADDVRLAADVPVDEPLVLDGPAEGSLVAEVTTTLGPRSRGLRRVVRAGRREAVATTCRVPARGSGSGTSARPLDVTGEQRDR
ncbi:MATE family efflux transporter [Luteimicrobium subarcticum]|uniref:Putative MATE family efflux protein n=1 Tax=Luteimicrobium subarcticum TaxID=620910 RepID=A0A2M8WJP8_9MICO|nr:MATE family efflux transporter [Luteimicrobium subarcticum]PJI91167.1 putative MATE family efflux protein [Luteimicrobium subarcticum]